MRLGPNEILSALGEGGMGEVYRARDTRLNRNVAIKVLPAEVAQDAQLRLRLEREAKAVSSLDHPHICALYDIGRENGIDYLGREFTFDYLVMELLEGETLAAKLAKGPLPFDQVLRYGMEIADALQSPPQRNHPSRSETKQSDRDPIRREAARLWPRQARHAPESTWPA